MASVAIAMRDPASFEARMNAIDEVMECVELGGSNHDGLEFSSTFSLQQFCEISRVVGADDPEELRTIQFASSSSSNCEFFIRWAFQPSISISINN